MKKDYLYVGKEFSINDAAAKVRGELKYISDMNMCSMLHLKLITSPYAHANIKKINKAKAESMEGVFKVFSFEDYKLGRKYNTYRQFPKQDLCPEDRYIFADKARFIGDIVAVVAACDIETAREAAHLVEIEYEALPFAVNPHDSLRDGACPIHENGNLIEEFERERKFEGLSIEREEFFEVTTHHSTQKMNHVAIETHCYVADYNSHEGLTIWSPTQGIFGVRIAVADMLGLPYNKVRIIKAQMGGSFGGKTEYVFEPIVAFIAMEVKRPVKLHLTRRDNMISNPARTYIETSLSSSFTKEGQILEFKADTLFDAGGYCGSGLDYPHAMTAKLTKQYRFPTYKHHCRVVYTNTPVAGGMRGWATPEMVTVMEIHLDLAARKLNLDPTDLRMRNLVEANDIDISNGISVGNAQVKKCLEIGIEEFSWRERFARPKDNGRIRRGVGIACGSQKSTMYDAYPDLSTMTIRMNEDGSVSMQTSLHDVGCGSVRVMQILVGEILQIAPDEILVTEGDTKYSPYDSGTYSSRVTYIAGECAVNAALGMKDLMLEAASKLLGKDKESLEISHGRVNIIGETDGGLDYRTLSTRTLMEQQKELILTVTHQAKSNPCAYAVNFVEVEVDTFTGRVKVTDFLAVHDIGQAINRGMVHRQIQGGVQMALGYGLCEDIKVNRSGNSDSDSLRKYHTINCVDMPRVKSILVEEGEFHGPFGAKSVGEIATVPGTAAVVNAINNALGTEMTILPLTPEKVLEALRKLDAVSEG